MISPCAEWGDGPSTTTPFGCCPSTAFLSVWPHCIYMKHAKKILITFVELEETTMMHLYHLDEDYTAGPEIK